MSETEFPCMECGRVTSPANSVIVAFTDDCGAVCGDCESRPHIPTTVAAVELEEHLQQQAMIDDIIKENYVDATGN